MSTRSCKSPRISRMDFPLIGHPARPSVGSTRSADALLIIYLAPTEATLRIDRIRKRLLRLRLLRKVLARRSNRELRLSSRQRTPKTTLDPDDPVYAAKRRPQIIKHRFVLMPELLDVLIELPLRSANLLRNQIGAVLQVVTDVTHVMFPQFSIRLQGQSRTGVPANPSEAVDYERDVTFQQRTGRSRARTPSGWLAC